MRDKLIVKRIQHLVESIARNSLQSFMSVGWKTSASKDYIFGRHSLPVASATARHKRLLPLMTAVTWPA
jgi:hypothetical protein